MDLLAILVLLAALAGAWRMTAPVAADPMARLRRLVDRRQIGETFEMQAANLPLGAAAGAGWETDEGAETFVRFVHGWPTPWPARRRCARCSTAPDTCPRRRRT